MLKKHYQTSRTRRFKSNPHETQAKPDYRPGNRTPQGPQKGSSPSKLSLKEITV
jgi:hypothetical protein